MLKYLYLILALLITTCGNLIAQVSIDNKVLGIWHFIGENRGGYLIFINEHSGAFTSDTRLLQYYFTYQFSAGGQPTLITQHFPIYNDRQYSSKGLVSLKNDSTLIINREIKGKKALLTEGKKIFVYKKVTNENIETFIRKPNQNDLIGTWMSILKKIQPCYLLLKATILLMLRLPRLTKQRIQSIK